MFHIRRVAPLKLPVLWCIVPLKSSFDDVADSPTAAFLQEELRQETGKDRLYSMFTFTKDGDISRELNSSIHAGLTGLFFGALYGGFIRSRKAYLEFFEQNQATAFKSHFEAKRVLQDHVTVNFAKGAIAWGWRLGLFSGTLMLASTSISVYRGKCGIIEYSVAGGVSGCLFRSSLGLRGMVVGGLLGTTLGTVGGCLIVALLKVSGLTMEDIRGVQYQWHEYRTRARAQSVKAALEEQSVAGDLLKRRDAKTGERESLDLLPQSVSDK